MLIRPQNKKKIKDGWKTVTPWDIFPERRFNKGFYLFYDGLLFLPHSRPLEARSHVGLNKWLFLFWQMIHTDRNVCKHFYQFSVFFGVDRVSAKRLII